MINRQHGNKANEEDGGRSLEQLLDRDNSSEILIGAGWDSIGHKYNLTQVQLDTCFKNKS